MPLPILSSPHATPEDLIRFYHRCELHWCRQTAEDETVLDVGTALANRALPLVHMANVVLDASLPEGVGAEAAAKEVDDHFRTAANTRCWKWILNPSAPADRKTPLADYLTAHGYARQDYDIMYLGGGAPVRPIEEIPGLTIIPVRASFRHARRLVEEATARWSLPQVVEADMLHFEDPQTDALLAMKDGVPAAWVSVLTVGEMGCIEDVFVSEPFRRQGIGRTMMSRALEICARSLFKHVFLSCEPTNAPAIELYRQIGFNRIGAFTQYRATA